MNDTTDMIGRSSRVTLHYAIHLADGMEVDSTFGGEPLTFDMGDGTLIEGLETALLGLRAGEEQNLTLAPEQAFGYRDTENIHDLPRKDFPDDVELEPGLIMDFSLPTGDSIPGMVLEVAEGAVKVDFNHPLAGHEIVFKAKVLAVENDAKD